MNAMECILSRRSIRSYTGAMPDREELDAVLAAAHASPVGMGRYENIMLTVIRNKAFLSALDARTAEALGLEGAHPLYGAPVLVVVSSRFPGAPNENSAYSNAAIAAENMALAAAAQGLGACLIWGAIRTLNASADLLDQLGLPEDFRPCCAVTLGKTEEAYPLRTEPAHHMRTEYMD